MKGLSALAAALTWIIMLCVILAATGHQNAVTAGASGAWTLALVAALAVGLTWGVAISPLRSLTGYVVAHAAGAAVAVAAMEWPRPPWSWHAVPGLTALFAHGMTNPNGATLALLFGALTWELAYACTWLIVRERRVWLALSLIVAILTLTAQPPGRDVYLAAVCAVGLVVVLVTATIERHLTRPRRLHSGVALRLTPVLLVPLLVGLVAGAWAAPVPSKFLSSWVPKSLSSSPSASTPQPSNSATQQPSNPATQALGSFGDALRVGGRFTPSATLILAGRVAAPWRALYWRGAVYDRYANGVWHTLPLHTVSESGDALLPAPDGMPAAAAITQEITLLQPSNMLFTAGQPLSVQVPSIASFAAAVPQAGVLALAPAHGALSGSYRALSAPPPSAPLSPAPVLPSLVRAIDLALPALQPRVAALAHRLTAGSVDPYARALAIQDYLRGSDGRTAVRPYRYDVAPPQAPAGEDPVDYLLFTSRRGFCTHFATAMVVLARLAGIPARLIAGYTAGRFDGARFQVTAADAHAWPELWIAGRGWTTFEPTPSFPVLGQANGGPTGATPGATRASVAPTPTPSRATPPANTASAAHTAASGVAGPSQTATARTTRAAITSTVVLPSATPAMAATNPGAGPGAPGMLLRLAPFALVAFVSLMLAFVLFTQRRHPDALALYRRMCRLASLLRAGPRRGQTPLEWAAEVATRVPDDGVAVLALTNLYVRQRYGGHRPEPADLAAARAAWHTLRGRWIKRLLVRRQLS